MDTQITIATIGGLLGIFFGLWTWLNSRDKNTEENTKEFTELKIKVGVYKTELDQLKKRVDTLDLNVMKKIDDLSKKIDDVVIKLMEQWKK